MCTLPPERHFFFQKGDQRRRKEKPEHRAMFSSLGPLLLQDYYYMGRIQIPTMDRRLSISAQKSPHGSSLETGSDQWRQTQQTCSHKNHTSSLSRAEICKLF